nr:hypothetical protein [Tanacetum cinerariifolium]
MCHEQVVLCDMLMERKSMRIRIRCSIEKGMHKLKEIPAPDSLSNAPVLRPHTYSDLMRNDNLNYEADIDAINWILLGIPNDIYKSFDSCSAAQQMWKRTHKRQSRFMNELDKFSTNTDESLESIAKRAARNHDPLALVANFNANSSSSRSLQQYYIIDPPSVLDHDDDYQGEIFAAKPEDTLSTTMMLMARAITQNFSTPTNNRLRTSSNITNQRMYMMVDPDEKLRFVFHNEVGPGIQPIQLWANELKKEFTKQVQDMLNVFESMEREVDEM